MVEISGIKLVYCKVNGTEVAQIRLLTDDGGFIVYDEVSKARHWYQHFGMVRHRLEDAHALFVEEKPHHRPR